MEDKVHIEVDEHVLFHLPDDSIMLARNTRLWICIIKTRERTHTIEKFIVSLTYSCINCIIEGNNK